MRMPSEFNLQLVLMFFLALKVKLQWDVKKKRERVSAVFHLLVLKDEDDDDDWQLAK